jgi:hypothetical protein
MDRQIAGRSEDIRTKAPHPVRQRNLARRVVMAFVAGLLATVVTSAAINWETVTEPVVQQ